MDNDGSQKLPRFFRLAKKESEKSKSDFPMGAVIVKGGRVLSRGFNKFKFSSSYGSGPFKNIHAEGDAIRNAVNRGIDISGSTVYVYRRNSNLAAPCKDCQKLLDMFSIASVVYTDRIGSVGNYAKRRVKKIEGAKAFI